MLSTNNKVSPPSSLKCSAIVRPVSATRNLLPGGSFICPYTSATLSITFASVISWKKSFPSRVLSPTPANTEDPLCSAAMLRINSIRITVLPTPAPPNKPTLEPFANGQIKSTTLIPVSRISISDACSENVGAAL